jgi:hypothetical protein
MRKYLLASVAALALTASSALAADMPVKAPPLVPFSPAWSGLYWGLGTYGGMAQSNVSGSGLLATSLVSNNVTASGGGVDGAIGLIRGDTAHLGFLNWYRLEGAGAYQNISGGIGGNSVASRWSATQEFDVGADVFAMLMQTVGSNWNLPTLTPPGLPSNIQVGAPKQYFGAIVREFGLDGTVGAAHGVTVGVAPGVKSGFLYQTLGANGLPNGGAIDLWASVTWNTRGATLGNVFASNGTPLTFNAGVNEGTTYLAGIRADFPVK